MQLTPTPIPASVKIVLVPSSTIILKKRNLEVNMGHPIIQNLSEILQKDKKHPFLIDSVEQLYENSLLIEGLLDNPSQVLSRFQKFMESASAYELEKIS